MLKKQMTQWQKWCFHFSLGGIQRGVITHAAELGGKTLLYKKHEKHTLGWPSKMKFELKCPHSLGLPQFKFHDTVPTISMLFILFVLMCFSA